MATTDDPTAADDDDLVLQSSFLGTGWGFPPEFSTNGAGVAMTADEDDVRASLEILFGTGAGERFLNPTYGLEVRGMVFEPFGTTAATLLKDQVRTAILVHEPRVDLVSLELDTAGGLEGLASVVVEYVVRATNSRFNLVYPFYLADGSEVRPGPPTGV